jgi:DivIVA domain-containing protein
MALTPEDVVNKRFQPTKFREGYDQDEVDDFLDEVVVELRRLVQENEELRQRLIASESRISDAGRTGAPASESEEVAEEAPVAAPAEPAVVPAPVAAVVPAPAPASAPAYDTDDETRDTTNLLQLARRLHEEHVREGLEKRDEYVREGSEKRDEYLREGTEKRDSLIAEAHATAARLLAEAEAEQRAQITTLEEERSVLEGRIDELRVFEREYRQTLKSYIEGHLRDLENPPTGLSETANVSGFAGK